MSLSNAPPAKRAKALRPEESSLLELSGRAMAEQYLAQRPENLKQLLMTLDEAQRGKAVHSAASLLAKEPDWAPSMFKADDVIAVITGAEMCDDVHYFFLGARGQPLDANSLSVFGHWFEHWQKANPTAEKRAENSEADGSATLCLTTELDELEESIEDLIEVLRERHEIEQGDNEDDEDFEEEDFDEDAVREEVRDDLLVLLQPSMKQSSNGKHPLRYTITPKITLRLQEV